MSKLNWQSRFFVFLIGTIMIFVLGVVSVNAQTRLTEQSKLALNGIGLIAVGMTVTEASEAAGIKLVQKSNASEGCFYFAPSKEPKNISFMVTEGRIARVDIDNKRMTTLRGAKIGDTQEQILSLYSGDIKVTNHPYLSRSPYNGKYLTFIPKDLVDKNYRMIFETSKNVVINFRSGKLPEVNYIEGCA